MIRRAHDAIVLDLDGTLVTDEGTIRPRVLDSLGAARDRGVVVMVATGRSEGGTKGVLEVLGGSEPAVVYNGAGVYCPSSRKLLEERVLSNRIVRRTLEYARSVGALPVVMRAGQKFAAEPRDGVEVSALSGLEDLSVTAEADLPREYLMRITLFSRSFADSEALYASFRGAVREPSYVTHFPLAALADHRRSPLLVLDVQPPCRGKAEALRVLHDRHRIPAERVVAVGDANNDVPMLVEAGLAVAMGNAFPSACAVADRVIGTNGTDAIADLVDELFG